MVLGVDQPARSTVHSELMIDAKVEIDAIAYKPVGKGGVTWRFALEARSRAVPRSRFR